MKIDKIKESITQSQPGCLMDQPRKMWNSIWWTYIQNAAETIFSNLFQTFHKYNLCFFLILEYFEFNPESDLEGKTKVPLRHLKQPVKAGSTHIPKGNILKCYDRKWVWIVSWCQKTRWGTQPGSATNNGVRCTRKEAGAQQFPGSKKEKMQSGTSLMGSGVDIEMRHHNMLSHLHQLVLPAILGKSHLYLLSFPGTIH